MTNTSNDIETIFGPALVIPQVVPLKVARVERPSEPAPPSLTNVLVTS